MTRMKYFYPEFLEPHSGWGRSAGALPRKHSKGRDEQSRRAPDRGQGFPRRHPNRHDEHRTGAGASRPALRRTVDAEEIGWMDR